MIRSLHAWIVICGFWAAFASQASAQPQDEVAVFFENKIRPILSRRCLECHGSKKAEGGLRLDTETGFKKGGESGAIVDVADRLKSPILQAIRYEGLEMPPKEKLPEDEIELLEAWVKHGAYWPKHAAPLVSSAGPREFSAEERGYWFYQPRKPIEVPSPAIGVKTTHPIDAFVLQRLSDQGLSLAPRADARTLARRAYLDLLGVPPTGEELQTFLNDASSDAYSKLVDRLLEDPRYGQRWGRYWLDLVRYAESDGYKQDDFRPTAYRYRDYVIRAFNEDKPYAQFVREQLAGDEIDRENPDVLDATGYLRLWIYEYNQRDVEGQWGAILNDLTDVTGEAFLVSASDARGAMTTNSIPCCKRTIIACRPTSLGSYLGRCSPGKRRRVRGLSQEACRMGSRNGEHTRGHG